MPKLRLEYLFTLYWQHQISEAEYEELMQLVADIANEDEVLEIIDNVARNLEQDAGRLDAEASDRVFRNILDKCGNTPPRVKTFKKWWLNIAAGIAAAIIVSLLITRKKVDEAPILDYNENEKIVPGTNKAFLQAGDGSMILLNACAGAAFDSETDTSSLASQQNCVLDELKIKALDTGYKTIVTPRGGRYRVELPDGSRVWLNAASSILYPVTFDPHQRMVEITGEVYFNVKSLLKEDQHTKVPFIVNIKSKSGDSAMVKVLGTTFNINAYDEKGMVEVTLKQGAVKVSKGENEQLLKNGQQARLYKDNLVAMVKDADIENALAWKKGVFSFEDQDIATIMGEISRWYDVEVEYQGSVSAARFDGKISRNVDINEVLEILRLSGVQFSIHHKTIRVH